MRYIILSFLFYKKVSLLSQKKDNNVDMLYKKGIMICQ